MILHKIGSTAGGRYDPRVALHSPTNRKRFGFSLIELLVSIMVLVTLTGILLPALHRAVRVSAPLVQCSNNLRQLYQSVTLYLADSNGVMPLADYQPLHESNYARLDVTLESYGGGSSELWMCPLDPRQQYNPRDVSSYLYPISKLQQKRTRIYFNALAQQYPILMDRTAFHPVETEVINTGPSPIYGREKKPDRVDQIFNYDPGPGYNRVSANGKVSAYPISESH